MDFSQDDLIKMAQGIARLRQKDVVDPDEVTAATVLFPSIQLRQSNNYYG
jgi:DNA replicative helicase MCM subunit Mcm2 (Cdc46/Mcm family)